jgi:hypothetical protein
MTVPLAHRSLTRANDSDVICRLGQSPGVEPGGLNAMGQTLSKALVFTILRHGEDLPWRMQEIGLMGLRLDDQREFRLHVWDPSRNVGEPPIHDHPYDFTSTIIAGELTNTRYVEDPAGDEYVRLRYSLPEEDQRRSDTVRLSGATETFAEGATYRQLAHELHASGQQPGTVTVIQCTWGEPRELTVCLRDVGSWRSGQGRDATGQEIKAFTAKALEWF